MNIRDSMKMKMSTFQLFRWSYSKIYEILVFSIKDSIVNMQVSVFNSSLHK